MRVYFKDYIVWYRVDRNLSRQEAADIFGVSVRTLANWERGKTSRCIFGYINDGEFEMRSDCERFLTSEDGAPEIIKLAFKLMYEHMKLKKAFYLLLEQNNNGERQ